MKKDSPSKSSWEGRLIGITGSRGTLGKALTTKLRSKGAIVLGFTHGEVPKKSLSAEDPNEWIKWRCGEEASLDSTLARLDILIINHGVNPQGKQDYSSINQSLEVNALSSWRLIQRFEELSLKRSSKSTCAKEVWVNTSEAEFQPALSPVYEISKRLIGQLATLRWVNLTKEQKKLFNIRKIILGPFPSKLNPFGIMNVNWVTSQILIQADLKLSLIIVTPNPLTYLLAPLNEIIRVLYAKIMDRK